jgi:hypothetical protein
VSDQTIDTFHSFYALACLASKFGFLILIGGSSMKFKLRVISHFILVVGLSLNAFAEVNQTEKPDLNTLMATINAAADELDPAVLEVMKANIAAAQKIENQGFIKMADQVKKSVFLTCTTAQGSILIGGRLGFCIDGSGNTYVLTGASMGIAMGIKGSLILGMVRTKTSDIRGEYRSPGVSTGFAAQHEAIKLGRLLKSLNVGLGVDIVYGKSSLNENTLILVGPSLGSMIDLSLVDITID